MAVMSSSRWVSARSHARSSSRRVPSSAMSTSVRASVVHGTLSTVVMSRALSVAPLWIRMPARRRAVDPGDETSIHG